MKAGDIILIRFPYTDLEKGKLRPALVVALAPGTHADLLLALITSRTYQAIPDFDEIIGKNDNDFNKTGLKVKSVVRLARLVTVESSIINARLGEISETRLREVKSRLAQWVKEHD